jgi:ABC-type Mn2+/Zn2+ transport system permease subunit
MTQMVDAVSRHVLTGVAGVMVARGYATQDQATAIVGGLMALIGVVWSLRNKHANAAAYNVALMTPVPASPNAPPAVGSPPANPNVPLLEQ